MVEKEKKACEHEWLVDHYSCCYVLRCRKCEKVTNAYIFQGDEPRIGDRVNLLEDGRTIEKIVSIKKKKEVKDS